LGYHKIYVSFLISMHVTTYADRLTKIGLAVAEIFGRIYQFSMSCRKKCSYYPHNLWNCWTKCHQNCTQCREVYSV